LLHDQLSNSVLEFKSLNSPSHRIMPALTALIHATRASERSMALRKVIKYKKSRPKQRDRIANFAAVFTHTHTQTNTEYDGRLVETKEIRYL
jgi:hypothetical protein